jgi:hypothetical protein
MFVWLLWIIHGIDVPIAKVALLLYVWNVTGWELAVLENITRCLYKEID